ncbi:hypothetical protein MAR_033297 [Mya arenaria]|uniref:Uncharacterized protein n=1 Tax=Mya arenaria TaxID=6604 RepID=A0ABY7G8L8_MYAAR|nr:hypothetical protein MAR_033297 [Mya arenaria]
MSDSEIERKMATDSENEQLEVDSHKETKQKRTPERTTPNLVKDDANDVDVTSTFTSTKERNGIVPMHHRLAESFLKRKYSELEDDGDSERVNNEDGKERENRLNEKLFSLRQQHREQMYPMDASFATLNHTTSIPMSSIMSTHSIPSATVTSMCTDRLKPALLPEQNIPGPSGKSDNSNRDSLNKEGPKLQMHKPSFMITDILSPEKGTNKRDIRDQRDACHSVFTDPRLFSLSHRTFIDRPLTASSCGSEHGPGGAGAPRFDDDDSDYDDDKSETDETV